MKILITGITGRIGSNVAKYFINSGHEVTGFSWSKAQKLEKMKNFGCQIITGDLENYDDVNNAVQGKEVIFHMGAAFQSGGPFSPGQYFDINVKGTFNILEASLNNNQLKHLIVTSTDGTIPKYPKKRIESPIGELTYLRMLRIGTVILKPWLKIYQEDILTLKNFLFQFLGSLWFLAGLKFASGTNFILVIFCNLLKESLNFQIYKIN